MPSLREIMSGISNTKTTTPIPEISNIESLKQEIIKANKAYRTGNPIISDEEYDILLSKLDCLMGFIAFDDFLISLTEEKGTIKLDYVLGSLTKLKYEEPENLYKWINKNKIKKVFASLKVDGCSFNASYRNGMLVMCSSRGDGETGTDWTEKSKYILPTVISYAADLDIRGEFTLTDDSHVILGGKNRRNSTVGIMNEKLVVPSKLKYVKGICYEVLSGTMEIEEQFSMLKEIGFITPEFIIFPDVTKKTHEALKSFYTDMKTLVNYDIDGLVISSPTYKSENVFFPEAKVAFKINSEGVNATVTGVEWNISKGGLLKPVVLIVPTTINGTTIGRVTGNNAKYILENEIKEGTIVSIIRSGEVIPKIINVINK
jgi:DNA ligase (NAD+)